MQAPPLSPRSPAPRGAGAWFTWTILPKCKRWLITCAKRDFTVYTPTLAPSGGQARLEELAGQLSTYVNTHLRRHEKFDLVGFSMGGVVCRYYLQRMGGLKRVDHFVTLGTPNHGTWWACLSISPGMPQMRPGSDFLNDLNSDAATLRKSNTPQCGLRST